MAKDVAVEQTKTVNVHIAVMGGDPKTVEVPAGTTVQAVLEKAGIDTKQAELTIRVGDAVTGLGTPVTENTTLVVSRRVVGG